MERDTLVCIPVLSIVIALDMTGRKTSLNQSSTSAELCTSGSLTSLVSPRTLFALPPVNNPASVLLTVLATFAGLSFLALAAPSRRTAGPRSSLGLSRRGLVGMEPQDEGRLSGGLVRWRGLCVDDRARQRGRRHGLDVGSSRLGLPPHAPRPSSDASSRLGLSVRADADIEQKAVAILQTEENAFNLRCWHFPSFLLRLDSQRVFQAREQAHTQLLWHGSRPRRPPQCVCVCSLAQDAR